MNPKSREDPGKLFKVVPRGTTVKEDDEFPILPGFQLVSEDELNRRQQRSFGSGRKCWWNGCCTVLTQYDDGELGRRAKKIIRSLYLGEHVVLCFIHQRHLNIGIFELSREEQIRFVREQLHKPDDPGAK